MRSFIFVLLATTALAQDTRTQQALAVPRVSVTPNPITGGTSSVTIEITAADADARGTIFNLVSSNPAVVSVPATAQTSRTMNSVRVTAQASPVAVDTAVKITAQAGQGLKGTGTLQVLAPLPASLSINPASVSGGAGVPVNAKVTLSGPAPAGGVALTAASNNAAATVPPQIVVPAGSSTAEFRVTTTQVAAPTPAEISVRGGNVTRTAPFEVLLRVILAKFIPNGVAGGNSATGEVTLSGPAPAGGVTVSMTWDGAPFGSHLCFPTPSFPPPVAVASGATSAPFSVSTRPSLPRDYAVRTSYGGDSRAWGGSLPGKLHIDNPRIASFEVPAQIAGGSVGFGRIKLNAALPSGCGHYVYMLSSSSTAIQIPSSVVIAAGSSEVSFQITAAPVQSEQTVTISISGTRFDSLLSTAQYANVSGAPPRTVVVTP